MKHILLSLLILCSLDISAQDVVVTRQKKQQTTVTRKKKVQKKVTVESVIAKIDKCMELEGQKRIEASIREIIADVNVLHHVRCSADDKREIISHLHNALDARRRYQHHLQKAKRLLSGIIYI